MTDVSTYKSDIVPCTDAFGYSFFYRTMIKWNNLPVDARQSECISQFKSKLVKHLWTADIDWPD